MMVLRSETVSVSWAVTGMVRDGLSDLTVREMTVSLDGESTSMASAEGGSATGIAMAGTFLGLS